MKDRLTALTPGLQAPVAVRRPLFADEDRLLAAVIVVGALIALWKLAIALTGNVIWEEAHFAVLGQRPDLAYPDIPAGWPLFARLCTGLFGWSAAAIRIPGLILAEAIPFAVYWLARAVVTRREALWAAMIAVVCPALGLSGTIFYPEEALQIAMALMLGGVIRAVAAERASDQLKYWAIAGAAGAFGLFMHFRFVLAGGGVLLFLLASPVGRRQWARPGLWLAGGLAALGILPGLLYNVREHWPALAYQVANRPSYRFMPSWFVTFVENQLGLATPAFLIAYGAAAPEAWREARHGGGAPALLLCCAGLIMGVYGALSLVDSQVMPHWPFLAYVALVPLAPGVLIRFVDAAVSLDARRLRMAAVGVFGPAFALAGAVAGTAFEEGWAHAGALPPNLKPYLFTRLEDWSAIEAPLEGAMAAARVRFPGSEPSIAASGHITALRLEFPGRRRTLYALDEPYDDFTRFSVIRKAWGLDEAGLRRGHAGGAAVLVLPEPSYLYNTPGEMAFRRRLCSEFAEIAPAGLVPLQPGMVAVELYSARIRPTPEDRAGCPLFPRLYLAQPTRGAVVKHGHRKTGLFGLASDPMGVQRVEIMLDGRVVAPAAYGIAPQTSPAPKALSDDPNYPRLWFSYALPGAALTKGEHRLAVRAILKDGTAKDGPDRTLFVR
jgi:hypothetical protein